MLIAVTTSLSSAGHTQSDEHHPTAITILTALPKDAAYERATAGLIDAGYAIADANAVGMTTSRRTFKNVWDLQLRVNVLAGRDSTRVIVTGTYWITCWVYLEVENKVVEGGRGGVAGKMWGRLKKAAESIRKAVERPPT